MHCKEHSFVFTQIDRFSHIVLDKEVVLNIIGQPYRNVVKIRLLRRFKWELDKPFQGKNGHFAKISVYLK